MPDRAIPQYSWYNFKVDPWKCFWILYGLVQSVVFFKPIFVKFDRQFDPDNRRESLIVLRLGREDEIRMLPFLLTVRCFLLTVEFFTYN